MALSPCRPTAGTFEICRTTLQIRPSFQRLTRSVPKSRSHQLGRERAVERGKRGPRRRGLSTGPTRNARGYWAFESLTDTRETVRSAVDGGGGGIRTHGTLARTTVFETVLIDHSSTPPGARVYRRASFGEQQLPARNGADAGKNGPNRTPGDAGAGRTGPKCLKELAFRPLEAVGAAGRPDRLRH